MNELEKINIKVEEKINEVYIPLIKDESRFLILWGGSSAGKSVFLTEKPLLRILEEKNHTILVLRKVSRDLRNSIFQEFKNTIYDWGLQEYTKFNQSYLEIEFPKFKSKIIFSGLDDVNRLKSIANVTMIIIEEATELEKNDLMQLNIRMRGESKSYKQIMLAFNPVYSNHWLKEFIETEKNLTSVHVIYKNNRFLTSEDIQILEDFKFTDPYYYDVYCKGIWGSLGELVFDQNKLYVEDLTHLQKEYFKVGCDFGFIEPSALIKVKLKEDKIYIFDEVYQRRLSNEQLAKTIINFNGCGLVRCDSAEPKTIQALQYRGIMAYGVKKSPGSVISGLRYLRAKEFHVDPRCQNFINEYRNLSWRKDKNGNPIEECEGMDHLIDAARYALEVEISNNLRSGYRPFSSDDFRNIGLL